MMLKRVYGYGRGSTNRQELTLKAQKRETGRIAKAVWGHRGFQLGGFYGDRGIKGSVPIGERPMGSRLCMRLDRGDCVVVTKLDRAFRDAADCAAQIKAWTEQGVILHALDCGLDTSTAVGRAVAQIMGVIAEMERHRISERQRESRAQMQRDGRVAGGFKRWGLVAQAIDGKKYWVIDQEERRIMGQIVRMRDARSTYQEIADYLNEYKLIPLARKRCITKATREKGGKWEWTITSVFEACKAEVRLRKNSTSAGSGSPPRIASSQ